MIRAKILIVSGRLSKGGAEKFVSTLLAGLDRKEFEVELCLFDNSIQYPIPSDISPHILYNDKIWLLPRTILRLRKLITRLQPDIILSNIALTNRVTGTALLGYTNKPIWVARVGNHPTLGGRSGLKNFINTLWDKVTYKYADHIIANSKGLTAALEKVSKKTARKTSTIYNPIDFSSIYQLATETLPNADSTQNEFIIMHAGRFHRQKRHDLLLESFSRVKRDSSVPVKLWLLGEGYMKNQIMNQIEKLDLTGDVILHGHVTNPFPLYRRADLFVLTSDWEGMPNVLIEAMALKTPCVSTDCHFGPAEIIENEISGYLAVQGDAQSISNNILKAIKNRPNKKMADKAKARVEKLFCLNHNIRLLTELFNKLLSDIQ